MRAKKRKICIVTTSRAEYGLLSWLMREIDYDRDLVLQLIVTGMHLESKFGDTYRQIEKDGFPIDKKIALNMSDDSVQGVCHSLSIGFLAFASAFKELKPDIIVVLGDRYELIPIVVTAVLMYIPVAHIHGGEITEGSMDEFIRHAITKLSTFHFASTEIYKRRIIQMGENPNRVFCYGAPGIDNIYRLPLLSKQELSKKLDITLNKTIILLTYHPATREINSAKITIRNIINALREIDCIAMFTMANADPGGSIINKIIEKVCAAYPQKFRFFKNLGQQIYLSCLKHLDLMVGNSSSGIIESSSFKIPVVNIGARQKGRLSAKNVIHVSNSLAEIKRGIVKALSPKFRQQIRKCVNPYDRFDDGKISTRIKEKLKKIKLDKSLLKKKFYDVKWNN